MQVNQKKTLKTTLAAIGSILIVISIIIRANGFYYSELPLFFVVLIIAFICLIVASKIKPDADNDAPVISSATPKTWKCSCGSENDGSEAFCGNCGNKKPEIPKPAFVSNEAVPKTWKCSCGAQNDKDSAFCWSCGEKKPSTPEV